MLHADGKWYAGSGAMIGPDLILTAAHNVYDREKGKWATYVEASPSRNRDVGSLYGDYSAENYVILSGFQSQVQAKDAHSYDMAVIKLNRPVDERVGQLSTAKTATVGQYVQMTGYPFESPHKFGYMYTMFGNIDRIDQKIIRYQIDAEGGQSGGPVLNDQGQIIGVHIAGFSFGSWNVYNVARVVDEDTDKLIEALLTEIETEGVASYKPLNSRPMTTTTTQSTTKASTTQSSTKPSTATEVTTTSQATTTVTQSITQPITATKAPTTKASTQPTTVTKVTTSSKSTTKLPTTSQVTTVTKPTTKSSTKVTVTTKPNTKPKAPTTTKATTKPSTKSSTKATTKAGTKPTTKATTKSTSKATTKSTSKATTKSTSKATTKATTKRTTKATTKNTTKPSVKTEAVYRLYHADIKRHLYTKSAYEAKVLSSRGWNFEGEKFRTVSQGTTPVYRLYHSGTREHLYTTSTNERDTLKTRSWRYEGIAWYSTGKKPIYRLYHAGLKVHLYTADANEKNVLSKRGWTYETIAFYVEK